MFSCHVEWPILIFFPSQTGGLNMKSLSLISGRQGVWQQLRRQEAPSHPLLHLPPIQIMYSVLIAVVDLMNMPRRGTYHFVKNKRVAWQIHHQQNQKVWPSENRYMQCRSISKYVLKVCSQMKWKHSMKKICFSVCGMLKFMVSSNYM